MTNIEQYLTYIKNEVKFMAGSAVGSQSNAPYADRVIQDVCGVSKFCSSVLASSKPSVVIMAVLQGTRGSAIMHFFDAQLHDARLEMVSLLRNATAQRTSKSEYDAMKKLYNKSVKRARKLIGVKGGSKSDALDEYPSLKALTGMGSSTIDLFDDDDEDPNFTSYEDYADAYLEAIRNGEEPPMPTTYRPKLELDLTKNDGILEMVNRIQERIGRSLTAKEMIDVITAAQDQEEDDDSEESEHAAIPAIDARMAGMMDQIANMVVAKLGMSADNESMIDAVRATQPKAGFESFDDWMERNAVQGAEESEETLPESVAISVDSGGDDTKASSAITPPPAPEAPKATEVPPVKNTVEVKDAAELHTSDLIRARNRGDLSGLEKSGEDSKEETAPSESKGPAENAGPEITPEAPEEEGVEHSEAPEISEATEDSTATLLDQVFESQFSLELKSLVDAYREKVQKYLESVDAGPKDVNAFIEPAGSPDKVLRVQASILVDDPESVDEFRLVTIGSQLVEQLARHYGIDESLIELTTSENVSKHSLLHHFTTASTLPDNPIGLYWGIQHAAVVAALYLYKATGRPADVRYLEDSKDLERFTIYVSKYDSEELTSDEVQAQDRQLAEAYLQMGAFTRKCERNGLLVNTVLLDGADEWESIFLKALSETLANSPVVQGLLKSMTSETTRYMADLLEVYSVTWSEESNRRVADTSLVTTPTQAGFDIMYNIGYTGDLSAENEQELDRDFEVTYTAGTGIQHVLKLVSNAICITGYLNLVDVTERDDPEEAPETDSSATSAFGV